MPDGQRDPEQLLTEARQGFKDSLGALLEIYRNWLYLMARAQIDLHLRARANPSDVVQETLMEAYKHFPDFRGEGERSWMAWLRRILIHQVSGLVEKQVLTKKRSVRREVSLEWWRGRVNDSAACFENALVSGLSSPSVAAQRREHAVLLADRLAELSDPHREVIVLRNLEGLPFDEVARRMGRSPVAVRILWLRALEQLRRLQGMENLQ